MAVSLDLLVNAIVAGILLGGFYAAVSVGITISFGMLDIANIAQPAFILLGSYAAYMFNSSFGLDPILVGIVMLPVFYVIGMAVYRLYYYSFELRGEQAIQGLAFFFGLLFVAEVSLVLIFGVDYRFVEAPYTEGSLHLGMLNLPFRMLIPFVFSLIIIQPIEPSIGRDYIGRIFAICVLGGMTSFPGMVVASMLIGIVESITATFYGPSWAPAVAFGFLLVTLAVRPAGLAGR